MKPPVARLTGVSLQYGKTRALDEITVDLPAGCMVGLIGPDGVGKSSLLPIGHGLCYGRRSFLAHRNPDSVGVIIRRSGYSAIRACRRFRDGAADLNVSIGSGCSHRTVAVSLDRPGQAIKRVRRRSS